MTERDYQIHLAYNNAMTSADNHLDNNFIDDFDVDDISFFEGETDETPPPPLVNFDTGWSMSMS